MKLSAPIIALCLACSSMLVSCDNETDAAAPYVIDFIDITKPDSIQVSINGKEVLEAFLTFEPSTGFCARIYHYGNEKEIQLTVGPTAYSDDNSYAAKTWTLKKESGRFVVVEYIEGSKELTVTQMTDGYSYL